MTQERCRYFEVCNAPLCPEDPESLAHCAWFPSEEICRKMPRPSWVSRQNTIARKLEKNFDAGCFTLSMLQQPCRISAGTKGVDPDQGEPHDLESAWLKKHPAYTESEKQIAARKKRAYPRRGSCKNDAVPGGLEGVSPAKGIQIPPRAS